MYIKSNIPHTLSLEESVEMDSLLSKENIHELLKLVNKNIAYNSEREVGAWAYANYTLPSSGKPKGSFNPNSMMFDCLKNTCIVIYSKNGIYTKELRVQTIPLPL